jgi:hypothetical protein
MHCFPESEGYGSEPSRPKPRAFQEKPALEVLPGGRSSREFLYSDEFESAVAELVGRGFGRPFARYWMAVRFGLPEEILAPIREDAR